MSLLAIQFAVLGQVDVAFRLVSRLNTFDSHHRYYAITRPLWLLWDLMGSWPAGEEERARRQIEKARNRAREEEDDGTRKSKQAKLDVADKPITRQDIKAEVDALARGYEISWWSPDKEVSYALVQKDPDYKLLYDRDLSPVDKEEAINEMVKTLGKQGSDAATGGRAIGNSSGLVSALNLTIWLKSEDADSESAKRAPSPEHIIDLIASRMGANQQPEYLLQARRALPMIRDGALAKAMGVDEASMTQFAHELEEAFDERISNGRLLPSDTDVKEILQRLQRNTQTSPDALEYFQESEEEPPKTLFKDPADEASIKAAEERLKIPLPDDYKEFLRLSNGFGQAFGGILMEPPLHPLDKVDWFPEDADYFTDLPLDIPYDCPFSLSDEIRETWPQVGMAIEIGTYDIDNTWLIPPSKITEVKDKLVPIVEDTTGKWAEDVKRSLKNAMESFAGSVEEFKKLDWGCLTWAAGGSASMYCYPSFKAYLMSVAEEGANYDEDILRDRKFIGYYLKKEEESKS